MKSSGLIASFSLYSILTQLLFTPTISTHSNLDFKHETNKQSLDYDDNQKQLAINETETVNSCHDCKLMSQSINLILKHPRRMNEFGIVDDKLDLDKIKNTICSELMSDELKGRCRTFFFKHLKRIEDWKKVRSTASLFDYLCIKELKLCCPNFSYGSRCKKCPECGMYKKCRFEGTRAGDGSCGCVVGHSGKDCAECSKGFFISQSQKKTDRNFSNEIKCEPCHKSCIECRANGPSGCKVCRKGFEWISSYGCLDIDECLQGDRKICGTNTFCVNTEGSYFCYECDRGCDGCHGDGPDMCLRCAKNYHLEDGYCKADKTTVLPAEANYYRYVIYLGLSICTCIIFQNNSAIAALIGLGVAMYIGFSEYLVSTVTNMKT